MKIASLVFLVHTIIPVCWTACADELNADLWQCVGKHVESNHLHHIAQISKVAREGAARNIPFHKYVGGNPSFVQAMRRCMFNDDVECVDVVQEYFQEEKPLRINQLPALAAHMGAKKIFFKLGYTRDDERWQGWMDRSKWHSPDGFEGKTFAQKHSWVNTSQIYATIKDPQVYGPGAKSILYGKIPGSKEPESGIPSAYEILSILQTSNRREKAGKAEEMKETLTALLQSGTYILDDTLKTPSVTWLLWYFHGRHDTISASFLKWLIQEGAPIDERGLFLWYESFHVPKPYPIPDRYKEMLRMAVTYSSGTPTRSLTRFVETSGVLYFNMLLPAMKVYDHVFGPDIDLLAPSILRAIAYSCDRYASKKNDLEGLNDNLSPQKISSTLTTYLHRKGLRSETMERLRESVNQLPDSDHKKNHILKGIQIIDGHFRNLVLEF